MSAELQKFRALYEKTYSFVLEVDDFEPGLACPAFRELMDAGDCLIRALGHDGSIVNPQAISNAKQHCRKSLCEAAEAGIEVALTWIIHEGRESVANGVCLTRSETLRRGGGRGRRRGVALHGAGRSRQAGLGKVLSGRAVPPGTETWTEFRVDSG